MPGTSIKQKVNATLKERRVDPTPISRIELVTSARYFGHAFNPVNFYYCYHNVADKINAADQSLDSTSNNEHLYAMIVEINNTFGETHVHVIKSDERALPLNATEDPYQNKKVRLYFPLIHSRLTNMNIELKYRALNLCLLLNLADLFLPLSDPFSICNSTVGFPIV